METIIWTGTLPGGITTTEVATIEKKEGYAVAGYITGVSGQDSFRVSYELAVNDGWNIRSVAVQSTIGTPGTFSFTKDESGAWFDGQQNRVGELDACEDIDISLTPLTNTLPVNRLRLAVGGSREIAAVYFDLVEGLVRPVRQRYTRITEKQYRYENLHSGFSSVIEVDAGGFVADYPGLWKRLLSPASSEAFPSALLSNGPSPELGPAASTYGWLIGSWDIMVHDYGRDGTQHVTQGEWHFAWILEGRAMEDVFITPVRTQRTPDMKKERNRCGISVRTYDARAQSWKIDWFNPVSGAHNELTGKRRGNEIVQEGRYDGKPIRWIFSDITPDSFRWSGEESPDNGKSWILSVEFFAARKR